MDKDGRVEPRLLLEDSFEGCQILHVIATQPPIRVGIEVARLDYDEFETVLREQLFPAPVVNRTLDSSVNSTDRNAFGMVEVRSGLVVLPLAVFDHQTAIGVVGIDR